MPLTVCPLSNLRLRVIADLASHPLKRMMEQGLTVTLNSDDPAYFGGYLSDNYIACARAFDLTEEDLFRIARNSFEASFLSPERKAALIARLDQFRYDIVSAPTAPAR